MKEYQKNFLLLSAGRIVSLIGSGIQALALSLYILDLTGSGTMMGTFLVVTLLPKVLFGPFGGILGDRFNRKNIMVLMDFGRGAVIFLLAYVAFNGTLALSMIYISQIFISIMDVVFDPSTNAMLPDIVPEEKLTKSNSVLGALNALSYIIGPALGGILYPLGIKVVFIINASSFVISAVSEMFIRYSQTTEKKKMTVKQIFGDLKDGITFFKDNKNILKILLFAMTTNFIFNPVLTVVLPFFARETVGFSSFQYGLMESSWVVGVLIGNIVIAIFLTQKSGGKLFKMGLIFEMILFGVFSLVIFPYFVQLFGGASWLYLGVISGIFIIVGFSNSFVNTPLNVFFQKAAPTEIRSRVLSVISVLSQLIVPLGTAIYGFLLDSFSPHLLTLVSFSIGMVVIVVFLAKGLFKTMDEKVNVKANPKALQKTEVEI
ncbi:MAG: hypothetical protein PWQ77_1108 [Kosmotogales bacterium]|nr:hypothetical protein [Kosmotogales bacterium]